MSGETTWSAIAARQPVSPRYRLRRRRRLPGGDRAHAASRVLVVGDQREMAAQLGHGGQLAAAFQGITDGSSRGFIDGEHRGRMRRSAEDRQERCRVAPRSRTQRRAPVGSALECRHSDRYPADMAQQPATPLGLIRGPSRFRLAVKPLAVPLRPYGWGNLRRRSRRRSCPPIGETLPDSEGGMGGRGDCAGADPGPFTSEPRPLLRTIQMGCSSHPAQVPGGRRIEKWGYPFSARGNMRRTVVPSPGAVLMSSLPSPSSTKRWTSHKPSPVPFPGSLVVKNEFGRIPHHVR